MKIREVLELAIAKGASDLHLRIPNPPVMRIDGSLVPQEDLPVLSIDDIEEAFKEVTTEEQREAFYRDLELDFVCSVSGLARFRVSVLQQRGTISMAFRLVPFRTPTIDELGIPQICKELVLKPRGLILVTGHTGAGKSTTLAAMINHLNQTERKNIVTIEDPIEYLYRNEKSIIAQRELGDDTKSFSMALEHVLRHDPDVIVVGEMRDIDTIGTAIRAAETGHLVLGTLHTTDAPQTIDRVIDIFQPSHQQQIRMQLSQVLEAVLCQTLLPRANGKGRVAAFEIMIGTAAVKNLIREAKPYEISNVMQLSSKDGMRTLEQSLVNLLKENVIKLDDAIAKCSHPEQLMKLLHY